MLHQMTVWNCRSNSYGHFRHQNFIAHVLDCDTPFTNDVQLEEGFCSFRIPHSPCKTEYLLQKVGLAALKFCPKWTFFVNMGHYYNTQNHFFWPRSLTLWYGYKTNPGTCWGIGSVISSWVHVSCQQNRLLFWLRTLWLAEYQHSSHLGRGKEDQL